MKKFFLLVVLCLLGILVVFSAFDGSEFLDPDSAEDVLLIPALAILIGLFFASKFPATRLGAPRLFSFRIIRPPILIA